MIALGVDSGSLSTGYGVVEGDGSRYHSVCYGAIRNPSSASQPHRIHKIVTGLREVIAETHPTILSIEDVFLSKNVKSAFKLGQIRGAVMALAMDQGLEVREFTPSQLKQAVTGYGQADKGQVQYMMKTILGLAEIPKPHDAADALALAISAITHEGWNRKVGSP